MQAIEERIGELLRSGNLAAVRDGLSNVLYWGWAQAPPGFQRKRVLAFRDHVVDDQLDGLHKLVPWIFDVPQCAGTHLRALKALKLPQFSQMSFTTKIFMFLRPDAYPVLDMRIAKAYANRTDYRPLQGLKFLGGIPITAGNVAGYERWAAWCRKIAWRVNDLHDSRYPTLRAVDVERALFTLTDGSEDGTAGLLLAGPSDDGK